MAKSAKGRPKAPHAKPAADEIPSVGIPLVDTEDPPQWNRRILILIICIGATVRIGHLFQPMRYDESLTYLYFSKLPWLQAISDYRLPNNHIFHTVLQKIVISLIGIEPWMLRIPTLLAGIMMMPLTWLVTRRLASETVALTATALIAGSGAMILYSTNARGYTLLVDASLILIWILLLQQAAPTLSRWALFTVITALGFWTIPIMLYPLGGIVLWALLLSRRDSPSWTTALTREMFVAPVACALTGGLLAGLLYLPVMVEKGSAPIVTNMYVTPHTFSTFFSESLEGLRLSWKLFATGLPPLFSVALLALAGVGIWTGRRAKAHWLPLLITAVGWSILLALVTRRFPFARTWLFLMPLFAIAAAQGVIALMGRVRQIHFPMRRQLMAPALLVITVGYAVASRAVLDSRETGALPEARQFAKLISEVTHEGDQVQAASFPALMYWLERFGVDRSIVMIDGRVHARRLMMVVNTDAGETVESYLANFRAIEPVFVAETLAAYPHAVMMGVFPKR